MTPHDCSQANPLRGWGAYVLCLMRSRVAAGSLCFRAGPADLRESATPRCLLAARDFRERPRVGCDGVGDGLAIDELPLATASDQPSFAQDFEMVGNGGGGHATHGDDLAAGHAVGCRDSLKDPEASLVPQRFRYFLNLRTPHGPTPQFRLAG